MPSYLQIENISKSYGPKVLFEHIGFNINEGDKIALIAPNGTGKTSLLKILAGKDKSDSGGKITFLKDIRISFLEQEYSFDPEKGIFDQIMSSSAELTADMDTGHLEEYRRKVRQFLTSLDLPDFGQKMKELSGGEVKRVAIAQMLASEADFFIMDEPTNHLDIDAIEFLEGYLSRSRCTLLMVDKVRNIFRRELEWMRSTPQARTGKARYRINAFYDLKDRASRTYTQKQVSMSGLHNDTYLGSKIINCKDISFYYGDSCYLDHFSYNFQRYEKVGIVGRNGAGKSTFINLITGSYTPDMVEEVQSAQAGGTADTAGGQVSHISDDNGHTGAARGRLYGKIERGESLKIGYYRQTGMEFNPDDTVLDIVNDTALLGRFLFPHDMLNSKVSRLSGGEKRRLYLLTILMKKPNLLVMDEPTNDLDIDAIEFLEGYLSGSLIIVSHDRHFLDRLVDHLFIFCGDGVIKDFIGSYSEYREYIKEYEARQKAASRAEEKAKNAEKAKSGRQGQGASSGGRTGTEAKRKLTYKEQRELEQIEKDLEALNSEKSELETAITGGTLPYDRLQQASERIGELISLIDEKESRWLELSI